MIAAPLKPMADAMQAAGIVLPAPKLRIWTWLKDHPRKSSREMATALDLAPGTTAAILKDMQDRKMLAVVQEPRMTLRGQKLTLVYTVNAKEYELLPKPLTMRKAFRAAANSAAPRAGQTPYERTLKVAPPPAPPTPSPAPAPQLVPSFSPEAFLSDLTLRQLQQVRAFLAVTFRADA